MWVWLSGKRPRSSGMAVRHEDKQRRCAVAGKLPDRAHPFRQRRRRPYQACRHVSDTDINVAHFLSSGLILFKGHFNGSPPHNYNPTT